MTYCCPAKINLGLNVVERRPDGYHNLETVFFPVPGLHDVLEVTPSVGAGPVPAHPHACATTLSNLHPDCDLTVTNMVIDGDVQNNLVVRAYKLLKEEFPTLPHVKARLHKAIPTQAGMGGGSSDGAAMLLILNKMFHLGLTEQQLIDRSARLGADCPIFILNRPAYAEGIGERLYPIELTLQGYKLVVVRPDIPVSTKEAFSLITPRHPEKCCRDIVAQPVETWRDELTNDFEKSVFALHPEIAAIKDKLYDLGAVYAAMSGSGSAVFGIFRDTLPTDILSDADTRHSLFKDMFVWASAD